MQSADCPNQNFTGFRHCSSLHHVLSGLSGKHFFLNYSFYDLLPFLVLINIVWLINSDYLIKFYKNVELLRRQVLLWWWSATGAFCYSAADWPARWHGLVIDQSQRSSYSTLGIILKIAIKVCDEDLLLVLSAIALLIGRQGGLGWSLTNHSAQAIAH